MTTHSNQARRIESKTEDTASTQILTTDNTATIQFDHQGDRHALVCTGENGGRIVSFTLNNKEILVQPNESGMFGSTFWTSPENWGWPPPRAIDSDHYDMSVDPSRRKVTLKSETDSKLGIRVEKTFSVTESGNAVHVDYSIMNVSDSPTRLAPWEISRVEKGGTTVYPKGPTKADVENRGKITVRQDGNICSYSHPSNMTDDAKHFDTAGDNWIAHTDGQLLFIKQFDKCRQAAPGESEIEIYACPNYVEVEQQGTYGPIAPMGAITWRVTWRLIELPTPTMKNDPLALAMLVRRTLTT